jgi:uncharacterized membrane protein YidH (DUF202 family)
MLRSISTNRLRGVGAMLCLVGSGLLLGGYLLFEWYGFALAMTGLLGWLNFIGYSAIALAVIGAVLFLASFVSRKR